MEKIVCIILILLMIFSISIFCSMLALFIWEAYEKNTNTLFIIIPSFIFLGWYFTSFLKHNKD